MQSGGDRCREEDFRSSGLPLHHHLRARPKDGGDRSKSLQLSNKSAAVTAYRDVGPIRARPKNFWRDLQCSRRKAVCESYISALPERFRTFLSTRSRDSGRTVPGTDDLSPRRRDGARAAGQNGLPRTASSPEPVQAATVRPAALARLAARRPRKQARRRPGPGRP